MSLNLILGPMFSGKSTELLRRYRRYTIAKKKCLLVRANIDNRYDNDKLCTHDKITENAIKCATIQELFDKVPTITEYDVICIDEIQFFSDADTKLEALITEHNIIIEASGLSGNFNREPFEVVKNLIPIAETVSMFTAVCMLCGGEAPFTYRIGSDKSEVVVGGKDKYMALCRCCYHKDKSGLLPE